MKVSSPGVTRLSYRKENRVLAGTSGRERNPPNTKDQRPGEYQPTLLLPNADWVLECRWCCENTGAPNTKEKAT